MLGEDLRAIRKQLGLSAYAWGQLLGFTGSRNSIQVTVSRLERGGYRIMPHTAMLAESYRVNGIPPNMRLVIDLPPPIQAPPAG